MSRKRTSLGNEQKLNIPPYAFCNHCIIETGTISNIYVLKRIFNASEVRNDIKQSGLLKYSLSIWNRRSHYGVVAWYGYNTNYLLNIPKGAYTTRSVTF